MNVGQLEIQLLANIARLQSDMNKATGTVGSAMSRIEKSVEGAKRALGALGVGVGLSAGIGQVVKLSDEYTKYTAQLRLATRSQQEYTQALNDVNRISTLAQVNLSSIGVLYARINNALRDLGVNQTDVAKITENVGLALKVSGATASESASAMLQLSQAFGSGVLRGEEFNAVNEAAPALMRALAESIGVPIGQLRSLAHDGKLTSDVLVRAFADDRLLSSFRQQAQEVQTISGAVQVFNNRILESVGFLSQKTGAVNGMSKAIQFATDNVNVLLAGLAGLLAFFTSKGLIVAITALAAAIGTVSAPILAVAGAVAILTSAYVAFGTESKKSLDELLIKEKELQKQIAFSKATLANRGKVPYLEDQLAKTQKLIAETKKLNQVTTVKQEKPYTGPVAPNFNSTVVVQDVNEIHRRQEEAARKAKEIQDKAKRARDLALQEEKDMALQESVYRAKIEDNFQNDLRKNFEQRKKDEAEAEQEAYEQKLKNIDLLQKQANKNQEEAQREQQRLAEQTQRQFERVAGEISQAFTNGLFESFRRGESFGKAMVRNIVALAQTWFARMFESLLTGGGFQKLLGSFAGLLGGGSAAMAGTTQPQQGGFNSVINAITDTFQSGNASLIGSINDLGVFLSSGNGGLGDTIGGFLGQYSAEIANVLPYAGAFMKLVQGDVKGAAFTAAGTAIGSIFGPIGAGIGAVLGSVVGGLLGGKRQPPRQAGSATASIVDGQLISGMGSLSGRFSFNEGLASGLQQANTIFASSLSALLSGFGRDGDVTASSTYAGRPRGSSYQSFNAQFDGQSFNIPLFRNRKAFGEADFNAFLQRITSEFLAQAIQRTSLAEGVKKFFNNLTKTEDIQEAIKTLVTLNNALKDLPPVFDAVRNAIDTTAYTTSIEALKAQFQATQTFVDLFYSDAERFDLFTKQLTSQLNALNQALPTSRDEYRALVESIKVADEATRDQFNGLVSLAPAMDQYFKLLEQQAGGIEQVNEALAQSINADLFSTYADFVTAQARAGAGMTFTGEMGELSVKRSQNNSPELIAEVQELKSEQANTKTVLEAIAIYMNDMNRTIQRWNGDGMPEVREI